MLARHKGENKVFGITDPMIWAAYAASILTVVFCCAYGWLKRDGGDE